ncbi:hypothetical protein CSC3H3_08645 [Thalassospira marina]|uniref:Uncharacterized protein n=1 Tax=Thalassospira marina TaxID=2048283 RepID=A0ABM6Q8F2_9PROT|nr:hypothetical protein CSC3H3_08645 [Thalassospira marina]
MQQVGVYPRHKSVCRDAAKNFDCVPRAYWQFPGFGFGWFLVVSAGFVWAVFALIGILAQ